MFLKTMVKRFGTKSVSKRIIPKTFVDENKELDVKQDVVREPQPEPRVTISPLKNHTRRCNVDEFIPVLFEEFTHEVSRVGVLNHPKLGGNIFHAVLYSTYLPYREWDKTKRLRKTAEFRQDLARDFPVFMMRLDQRSVNWGSPRDCQKELVDTTHTKIEFLNYICKMINKTIYIVKITDIGLQIIRVFNHSQEANCIILVENDTDGDKVYEPVLFNRVHSVFPKNHKLVSLLTSI